MNHRELRKLFSEFLEKREHKWIEPISLVPQDDPTTLFTSSGMQQLVPYLLGKKHYLGTRLYNIQRCLRSQDIEEVGDNRHTTFFEMLGNWSLGDYFKKEQLNWFFELLVEKLGFSPDRLYATVFVGDKRYRLKEDKESIIIWKEIFRRYGIKAEVGERIFLYPASHNWWSRAGEPSSMPSGEPGGPDSEVFYEFRNVKHDSRYGEKCHPNCQCGRFLEIGNSVFMEYVKRGERFEELPRKNVDFGGGLERILAALNDDPDVFKTDLYWPLVKLVSRFTEREYEEDKESMRIIVDHLKASTFLINDGVFPSNKEQGYVLRRLLRRAVLRLRLMGVSSERSFTQEFVRDVIEIYGEIYFQEHSFEKITNVIEEEANRFSVALNKGLKEVEKIDKIDGKKAFDLYQNYGFPLELTEEIFKHKGQEIDKKVFCEEFKEHREISQRGVKKRFKSGLEDNSQEVIKYHTATHLLHQALSDVLGKSVRQKGSNITAERLRFDFYSSKRPTEEDVKKVEEIVNNKIREGLRVCYKVFPRDEAYKIGAKAFFREKYPDKVKVYFIASDCKKLDEAYSKEFCNGPHVENTKEIGKIEIYKFKKIGSNIYRIYAR